MDRSVGNENPKGDVNLVVYCTVGVGGCWTTAWLKVEKGLRRLVKGWKIM